MAVEDVKLGNAEDDESSDDEMQERLKSSIAFLSLILILFFKTAMHIHILHIGISSVCNVREIVSYTVSN